MEKMTREDVFTRYLDWFQVHNQQAGKLHHQLLDLRRDQLRQLAGLIENQVDACGTAPAKQAAALFSTADLQEFAAGDIVKCLGQDYAIYEGRRSPRIPNGDLLMMSRIMSLKGVRHQFSQPASILAEYDVPVDAWYFQQGFGNQLPYSLALETALQPCGFLSAYLGTSLRFPETDFFFRNLDGQAQFIRHVDVVGKTIRTHAELLKTVFSGTTIIQHFIFEMTVDGEAFFRGSSTFGYFSTQMMVNQAGLDNGRAVSPWIQNASEFSSHPLVDLTGKGVQDGLPEGKLRLLHRAAILPDGGENKAGYLFGSRNNSDDDWYYACHFYQDPVMPGSLGIEAVIQAIRYYASQQNPQYSKIVPLTGSDMTWKYRGQVLKRHSQMQLEVHFRKDLEQLGGARRQFIADASVWADEMRIYELRNLAFSLP